MNSFKGRYKIPRKLKLSFWSKVQFKLSPFKGKNESSTYLNLYKSDGYLDSSKITLIQKFWKSNRPILLPLKRIANKTFFIFYLENIYSLKFNFHTQIQYKVVMCTAWSYVVEPQFNVFQRKKLLKMRQIFVLNS